MEFNIDKCVIMNIGNSRNKSKIEYNMKNKPLGVELTDNMKYNQHIYDIITTKTSKVFGFVKRNLIHCLKTVKE